MTEQMIDPSIAVRPEEDLRPEDIRPDISHILTEDDEAVDNLFSAKQQRLLVEPLYSAWQAERSFVADANVGVFSAINRPPLVPDVFLSVDVEAPADLWPQENRSYFIWEYGKPPDVAIEVVSNTRGREADHKLREYARMRVLYYVIFDPQRLIQSQPLRIYELHVGKYLPKEDPLLDEVGLGLTLWEGAYDRVQESWLRWLDADGNLIPTGAERAERERERAERLAAQLRALGIEPEA